MKQSFLRVDSFVGDGRFRVSHTQHAVQFIGTTAVPTVKNTITATSTEYSIHRL